jgi:anti-sigma factor RsiW
MPNCQIIDALVTPYVDGQLPDADRRAVDQHLSVCPPCFSRVEAERAVHELIGARRAQLAAPRASGALRARCRDHAVHVRPPTLAAWRARLAPLAAAASLVLVVGAAFLYQLTGASNRVMAAELAADHVKCFAMNSALGTHEGAGAVESTMLASFDWRMHLPANADRAGLELVGARPCLYGEGKIAHIMYRHDGHPLSLFMLPNTARSKDLIEVLGHEAAVWCANNRTYVLVSREPRADVERLAAFVQASLRQEQ